MASLSDAGGVAASTSCSGGKRQSNTSLCLPIAYGSIAFYLGKKADEYATHKWTLYLRGPTGDEDLSPAISKVIFQLHPSFPQPIREISEPPYEVTEKGWGEFEASIRILWQDAQERPTVLTHGIKLYPPGLPAQITAQNAATQLQSDDPVIAERYDEVVFTDPTDSFFQHLQRLQRVPKLSEGDRSYNADCLAHFQQSNFSDEVLVQRLLAAHIFLEEEVRSAKDRIIQAQEETKVLEADIIAVTAEAQAATATLKAAQSKGSHKGGGGVSSSKGGSSSSGTSGKKKKASSSSGGGISKKSKLSKASQPPAQSAPMVPSTSKNS
jgi:YEATS domain-containing protein 4